MNWTYLALLALASTLVGLSGCGSTPAEESTAQSDIDGTQFLLSAEPDGAVGVIAARESAEDGAPLVLVGRVGGSANPWIDGRAAFMLLDASMSVVAEGEDSAEGELCTGDCCATERLACTTLVKVVDAGGQVVPVDSRKLLGLKESDMVVVEGTAKKDKSGNFSMLANRVFIRK
ncbi:MAG: AbrB/MazE/SpoVT family DNA-binding domain-containing protein [Pirellulales bacterium]|nr:AbrB/MazE/SpoVT family DNA-binding domain-containing protein [Pirellulales bacterium]